ncbi:uncharacterized protein LOC116601409 isoform X2 [Nematostella vectensis]|uniref:uncharacterized protein LOC116601409 isoform X2 n=1 Tax=Nematostella vectensis TaxID=45351 RepID=UPI0020776EE7|nr:uncharacterized protein LOC116601409 isoform X2 [Nematostella vectensis]
MTTMVQVVAIVLICLVTCAICMPIEAAGSGDGNPAVHVAHDEPDHKPKFVDNSRGVYMHAHDFGRKPGAPRQAFHAQYSHASGGIGKSDHKRSLSEKMMKMFNVRLPRS